MDRGGRPESDLAAGKSGGDGWTASVSVAHAMQRGPLARESDGGGRGITNRRSRADTSSAATNHGFRRRCRCRRRGTPIYIPENAQSMHHTTHYSPLSITPVETGNVFSGRYIGSLSAHPHLLSTGPHTGPRALGPNMSKVDDTRPVNRTKQKALATKRSSVLHSIDFGFLLPCSSQHRSCFLVECPWAGKVVYSSSTYY